MRKKIIVLGSAGMLGHMVTKYLKSLDKYNIVSVARNAHYVLPDYCVDVVKDYEKLEHIFELEKPDIVINCIGMLIKECEEKPVLAFQVNEQFPHFLEKSLKTSKLVHISTNCVHTSRSKGMFRADEEAFPHDVYGKTKLRGEVLNNKDVTIRTSIVGIELDYRGSGLLNWVLKQTEPINGYTRAFWNGVTTLELAKFIDFCIEENLVGLRQYVTNRVTSKALLISDIVSVWNKKLPVVPCPDFEENKTLKGNTRQCAKSYFNQLKELKEFSEK